MSILLTTIHVLVCFLLIGIVLLQAGKGADIGAAFGSGASQTMFGSRGATTVLHKATAAVAITFMLTSLGLAYFSRQERGGSVVEQGVPAEAPAGAETGAAPQIPRTPPPDPLTPEGVPALPGTPGENVPPPDVPAPEAP